MKLYEVPRNTKIRVRGKIMTPPSSMPILRNDILTFEHLDGMYSYCTNQYGTVVHLSAMAEVEIVK